MPRKLLSYAFLIAGFVIGLGGFGHAIAVDNVHKAIDHLPISFEMRTTLYVVWYFVSGCMLVFGSTIVWTWFRLRANPATSLFAPALIGALYVVTGIGGILYQHTVPFGAAWIVVGSLVVVSSSVLSKRIA
jgi:hypothetical protein